MRELASEGGDRRLGKGQKGFTFLGLMFVVALLLLTVNLASVVWSLVQQRENERQLLFVGRQLQQAIERHRSRVAGAGQPYPLRLDDLLQDPRSLTPQRDLRQVYVDPMTGSRDWGLIRVAGGGIVGVHSLSEKAPMRRSEFSDAKSYRDWRFVALSATELLTDPATGQARAASSPALAVAAPAPAPAPGSTPAVAEPLPAGVVDEPVPAAAAATPRPTPGDYRSRTPEACDRIAAFDAHTCADQSVRHGAEAAAACEESAVRRNLACALNREGAMPSLTVRRN